MEAVKKKPIVIAFEGIDGSGKATQCNMMADDLRNQGFTVLIADYPRYEEFFGLEIGLLLSGKDKDRSAATLDPKSMALWYAADRLSDYAKHRHLWDVCDFVLLNRSTMSSMVYQALRAEEPLAMMHWVARLEFDELGVPKPDLFFVFDVSPKSSAANMQAKATRSYTEEALDVYEGDKDLQVKSWELYRSLYATRPDVALVPCEVKAGQLREKEEILESARQVLIERSLLVSDAEGKWKCGYPTAGFPGRR